VKQETGETWRQSHLADQQLHRLLEKVDADLAQEVCQQGCAYCGGKLHRANYERKARGGPHGIDATAFVVPNKIAGGGELRNRCVSWDGGSMPAWW
jgi:hypothetical protein